MQVAILISAGLISGTLAFVTNWLALSPWRRAKGQHWSERARLCFPVRIAATSNLWVLPATLTMVTALVWPEGSPHWMLVAISCSLGTLLGTIPLDAEVFPRIPSRELFRQAAIAWLIRFCQWFVLLTAITLTSPAFDLRNGLIFVCVVALCIFWNRDGWIQVGMKLGMFGRPPEHLLSLIRETAARANVSVHDTYLIRSSTAAAYALPATRRLLFSARLLELLSDEELSAVTAHELAHLSEGRSDYLKRYVIWLTFLPWVFFKPTVHALGPMGFFVLIGTTVAAPVFSRSVCRNLEVHADRAAQSDESAPGVYARALLKLHEDALIPAVLAKKQTHPDLYDRLLASGVQPEFPRPVPANPTAWNGVVFSMALGAAAMLLIIRLTS